MSISTKNKKLTVIIITYNSEKHVRKCIESTHKFWPTFLDEQIIVIDNNSQDKTKEVLKSIKGIELLLNTENLGFAKAVNQGINRAVGDYILLLNPDTEIMRDSFKYLVESLCVNRSGIVGGASFKDSGEQHGTYVREPNLMIGLFDFTNIQKIFPNNIWHRLFYYSDLSNISDDIEVDAVGGGYMLIDRKILSKIGLFDESFFMYLEDIDFCVRAKKHGYKVFYCPKSRIYHIGGASSNNKDHINFDAWVNSRRYYFQKHANLYENLIIQPVFIIDELLMRIKRIL